MVLTSEQIKLLTESRFWRPEIGVQYAVEFGNWRYDERTYKDDNEKRPTLVMDVLSVNGEVFTKPKEFDSSNKSMNKVLVSSIERAMREGREKIRVAILRVDKKNYQIVDYSFIDDVIGGVNGKQAKK